MEKQKLKQVKVNFTLDDYTNLSALSKAENISIAQFIRNKLKVKIDNAPSKKTTVTYKKTNPKLLYQLNKIGNNLNQIAKKLNSKNQYDSRAIFEIYNQVMSLK